MAILKSLLCLMYLINSASSTLPVCTNGNGIQADPGALSSKRGQTGQIFCFNIIGSSSGGLWGTDIYTDDSKLAKAAVHRGLVAVGEEKTVQVTILSRQSSYTSSTRNGITSGSYSSWVGSYTVDSLCTTNVCTSCNAGYLLQNGLCVLFPCIGSTPYMFKNGTCTGCSTPSYVLADGLNQTCIYVEPPKALTTQMSAVSGQIGAASTIGTLLANSGGSQGLSVSVLARLLEYIKYINVSHSDALEQTLQAQNGLFQMSPDFPQRLEDEIPTYQLPEVFSKYDVVSSFIINFWEKFFMILILLGIYIVLFALENIFKKGPNFLGKMKFMMGNILLSTVYNTFGDVVFFSILEFRATKQVASWTILSFIVAGAFIFICFTLFIMHIWLLCKQKPKRKVENSDKQRTDKDGLQLFFEDFKKNSIIQHGFLLWMIIRDLLFSAMLVTLFEYPMVQAIFIVLLSIIMLALLIFTRPFKEMIQCVQLMLSELTLLVIDLNILALAIHDKSAIENTNLIEISGKIIIYLSIAFSLITILFLLINLIDAILQALKRRRILQKGKLSTVKCKNIANLSISGLDNTQIVTLNNSNTHSQYMFQDSEAFPQAVIDVIDLEHRDKSRKDLSFSTMGTRVIEIRDQVQRFQKESRNKRKNPSETSEDRRAHQIQGEFDISMRKVINQISRKITIQKGRSDGMV